MVGLGLIHHQGRTPMGAAQKLRPRCACCMPRDPVSALDRRAFIGGLAAAGVSGTNYLSRAFAQGAPAGQAKPQRIDVHHHFSPPQWIAEVKGRELLQPANVNWTPAKSIEDMDQGGVAAAVISITNPGLWFGDKEVTRRIARECNEYGA